MSRIETETDGNGIITAVPSSRGGGGRWNNNQGSGGQGKRSTQPSYKTLGGDYLHFTLYKENKDTMDAVNQIARMLKIKSSNFGFAGTKDRRAATVQRVSVFRVQGRSLDFLNRQMPAIKMGDYKYHKHPMQLGDHGGNEFVITVKNCHLRHGEGCSVEVQVQMMKQAVSLAVQSATENGFVNYFGLQRFGTHSVGTQELGMLILRGEFETAIAALLHVDAHTMEEALKASERQLETANNRDDLNRARAIAQWNTCANAEAALKHMPKRFNAEASIIGHLARSRRDFQGALLTITRGMRQMYIHAYQSFVWNFVASRRWAKYGNKVVAGDLILVDSDLITDQTTDDIDDIKATDDSFYQKARALTAEEAASGKYTIFDVVLPTPGFDIVYPAGDLGDYYVEFMKKSENGGLDPYNMRRAQKEFSLSGSYRKLLARFTGNPTWEIRTYIDDNEQMYPTDLNKIHKRMNEQEPQRLPQEQTRQQGRQTTASGWNTFATNPAAFDNQVAAARRRQQDDTPDVEARINDEWIQTALDGGSKRIKIADADSASLADPAVGGVKLEPKVGDSAESSPAKYYGGGNGPLFSGGAPLYPQEDDDGQQQRTKPVQNTTGSTDINHPVYQEDKMDITSGSSAISGWPMTQKQAGQNTTSPPGPFGHDGTFDDVPDTKFGSQPASFQRRSTSPMDLDTQANKPRVNRNNAGSPNADAKTSWDFKQQDLSKYPEENIKIAAILKFRLQSSNYATIALRELMGQVQPDGGREFSQ